MKKTILGILTILTLVYSLHEFVGGFMASFKEFPPRNKPATFSVGDALKSFETASQH